MLGMLGRRGQTMLPDDGRPAGRRRGHQKAGHGDTARCRRRPWSPPQSASRSTLSCRPAIAGTRDGAVTTTLSRVDVDRRPGRSAAGLAAPAGRGLGVLTVGGRQPAPWVPNPDRPDVYVRGICRKRRSAWPVTLFLVNANRSPRNSRTGLGLPARASRRGPDGAGARPLSSINGSPIEHNTGSPEDRAWRCSTGTRSNSPWAWSRSLMPAVTRPSLRRDRAVDVQHRGHPHLRSGSQGAARSRRGAPAGRGRLDMAIYR